MIIKEDGEMNKNDNKKEIQLKVVEALQDECI